MLEITDGLVRRYLHKQNNRRAIGWTDFSRGSWDWRVATAKLYRIQRRLLGQRISFNEAFRELNH
jgi:hypothetical protein